MDRVGYVNSGYGGQENVSRYGGHKGDSKNQVYCNYYLHRLIYSFVLFAKYSEINLFTNDVASCH
jgi:hypothetical protein